MTEKNLFQKVRHLMERGEVASIEPLALEIVPIMPILEVNTRPSFGKKKPPRFEPEAAIQIARAMITLIDCNIRKKLALAEEDFVEEEYLEILEAMAEVFKRGHFKTPKEELEFFFQCQMLLWVGAGHAYPKFPGIHQVDVTQIPKGTKETLIRAAAITCEKLLEILTAPS